MCINCVFIHCHTVMLITCCIMIVYLCDILLTDLMFSWFNILQQREMGVVAIHVHV